MAQRTAQFGRVDVIGSGDLVQTLLRQELVDRLHLWVYPVLLGSGKRLFGEGTVPTALRLVESATFPKGACCSPTSAPASRPSAAWPRAFAASLQPQQHDRSDLDHRQLVGSHLSYRGKRSCRG